MLSTLRVGGIPLRSEVARTLVLAADLHPRTAAAARGALPGGRPPPTRRARRRGCANGNPRRRRTPRHQRRPELRPSRRYGASGSRTCHALRGGFLADLLCSVFAQQAGPCGSGVWQAGTVAAAGARRPSVVASGFRSGGCTSATGTASRAATRARVRRRPRWGGCRRPRSPVATVSLGREQVGLASTAGSRNNEPWQFSRAQRCIHRPFAASRRRRRPRSISDTGCTRPLGWLHDTAAAAGGPVVAPPPRLSSASA